MENKSISRLRGMLGFAMRAGKVIIGTEQVCVGMKRRGNERIRITLIAADASEATKKKICTKGEFYDIEVREIELDTASLGELLGKTYGPATVAICDDGFAKEIRAALSADK